MSIRLATGLTLLAIAGNEWASLFSAGILVLMAGSAVFSQGLVTHSKTAWISMSGFVLCAATCFLPGFLLQQPDWLQGILPLFSNDSDLTRFLSPQPYLSFHAWITLVAIAAWTIILTGLHWSAENRRKGLSAFAIGTTLIGGIYLYLESHHLGWPLSTTENQTGPFVNRNQTAAIFCVGATISFGLLLADSCKRPRSAALWTACLAIQTFAVLEVGSRAATAALALGLASLSTIFALEKRQAKHLAIGASIILLSGAFFFNQSELLGRITSTLTAPTSDARFGIWKDTASLIRQAPYTGAGLANFEPAIAQVRSSSVSEYRLVHPENDWLWLAAEIGIPGTMFALVFVGCVLIKIPWKRPPHVRSRHHFLQICSAVAVLQLLIFSIVDVPGHRTGTILSAILLAAIASSQNRHSQRDDLQSQGHCRPIPRWALAAVILLAAALTITIPNQSTHKRLVSELADLEITPQTFDATAHRAIAIAPLDWQSYFLRARFALSRGARPRDAQHDFHLARLLTPHSPKVARQEMHIWLNQGNPRHALPAWRDLVQRDPSRLDDTFSTMLTRAKDSPRVLKAISLYTSASPDLQLLALKHAPDNQAFSTLLSSLSPIHFSSDKWSPSQIEELIQWMETRGMDTEILSRYGDKTPEHERSTHTTSALTN